MRRVKNVTAMSLLRILILVVAGIKAQSVNYNNYQQLTTTRKIQGS